MFACEPSSPLHPCQQTSHRWSCSCAGSRRRHELPAETPALVTQHQWEEITCWRTLTPSMWESLTSVSSLLRLSGSFLVMGSSRTGWPETEEDRGGGRQGIRSATVTFSEDQSERATWRTADERGVGSGQGLHAGGAGQNVHSEPSVSVLQQVVLGRDQRRGGRPPVRPHHLGPPSLSCRGRHLK